MLVEVSDEPSVLDELVGMVGLDELPLTAVHWVDEVELDELVLLQLLDALTDELVDMGICDTDDDEVELEDVAVNDELEDVVDDMVVLQLGNDAMPLTVDEVGVEEDVLTVMLVRIDEIELVE